MGRPVTSGSFVTDQQMSYLGPSAKFLYVYSTLSFDAEIHASIWLAKKLENVCFPWSNSHGR